MLEVSGYSEPTGKKTSKKEGTLRFTQTLSNDVSGVFFYVAVGTYDLPDMQKRYSSSNRDGRELVSTLSAH